VLEVAPTDYPAQMYLKRCQHYQQTPPPADWNGAFIMKTK